MTFGLQEEQKERRMADRNAEASGDQAPCSVRQGIVKEPRKTMRKHTRKMIRGFKRNATCLTEQEVEGLCRCVEFSHGGEEGIRQEADVRTWSLRQRETLAAFARRIGEWSRNRCCKHWWNQWRRSCERKTWRWRTQPQGKRPKRRLVEKPRRDYLTFSTS
jgi:hypothetical protein